MDDMIFAYHCSICDRIIHTRQTEYVCCGEQMAAVRATIRSRSQTTHSIWGAVWLVTVLGLLGWLLWEIGAQVARIVY